MARLTVGRLLGGSLHNAGLDCAGQLKNPCPWTRAVQARAVQGELHFHREDQLRSDHPPPRCTEWRGGSKLLLPFHKETVGRVSMGTWDVQDLVLGGPGCLKVQVPLEGSQDKRTGKGGNARKLGCPGCFGDSVTWVSVAQVMQSRPLQATEGRGGRHSTRLWLGPVPPGEAHPEEMSEKVRSLWPRGGPEGASGREEA